jgi:hypothetical protein
MKRDRHLLIVRDLTNERASAAGMATGRVSWRGGPGSWPGLRLEQPDPRHPDRSRHDH